MPYQPSKTTPVRCALVLVALGCSPLAWALQAPSKLQVPTLAFDDRQIILVWEKPAEHAGIKDYRVYANGTLLGSATQAMGQGIATSYAQLAVDVFGVDIDRDRDGAMRLLGLVPQEINFNMFEKPLDICVNYAGFYGIPRAEALVRAEEELKRAQLWDKATTMSRTLSGGMKRRLMIARAMMTRRGC